MRAFHEVRNYQSDFMVWHGSYRDINFIAHWHREIELIYLRSGSAEIHAAGRALHVKTGDLVICDSGDIHFCDSHTEGTVMDFLLMDTAVISSHYKYCCFSASVLPSEALSRSGLDTELIRLFSLLDLELEQKAPYYQEIVKGELRGFWYRLIRLLPVSDPASSAQNRHAAIASRFQDILSYMEDHCDENITLRDAAERIGFSPSHFSKFFHQMTGTCFVQYLNFIRTSMAAEMLGTTNRKITEIAFSCGFSNIRTFNRVFLKNTGYTPSDYLRLPESKTNNFTYYRSSSDLVTLPDRNPTIRIS